MSILLTILGVIVGLIVLVLIIGLFSKKAYHIQREIVINRPKRDVFNYVKLLRNQDYYNKWVMTDPNMKKEFRGEDGTTGFVYGWNGNSKAGEGEQEIKAINENKIDWEIRFKRPFKGLSASTMTLSPVNGLDGSTNISWTFSSNMAYPANIMLLFGVEKMLGKDLVISMENLKKILEAKS